MPDVAEPEEQQSSEPWKDFSATPAAAEPWKDFTAAAAPMTAAEGEAVFPSGDMAPLRGSVPMPAGDPNAQTPLDAINRGVGAVTHGISSVAATAMNVPIDAINTFKRMTGHFGGPIERFDPDKSVLPKALRLDADQEPLTPDPNAPKLELPPGVDPEAVAKSDLDYGGTPAALFMGLERSGRKALEGFTTPGGVLTAPALALKPVQAAFVASMAASAPSQIEQTIATLKNKDATAAQKWESLGDSAIHLAMTAAPLLHMKPEEVIMKMSPDEARAATLLPKAAAEGLKDAVTPAEQPATPEPAKAGTTSAAPEAPAALPEPKAEQLTTTTLAGGTTAKPALTADYYGTLGDRVTEPATWHQWLDRILKGDVDPQESAFQLAAFIRKLGNEKGNRVIDALLQTHGEQKLANAELFKQLMAETDQTKRDAIQSSAGGRKMMSSQFPREAAEAAMGQAGDLVMEHLNKVAPPIDRSAKGAQTAPREAVGGTASEVDVRPPAGTGDEPASAGATGAAPAPEGTGGAAAGGTFQTGRGERSAGEGGGAGQLPGTAEPAGGGEAAAGAGAEPGAGGAQGVEPGVETPAEATDKIAKAVVETPEQGTLTPQAVKKTLVNELQNAIEAAPEENTLSKEAQKALGDHRSASSIENRVKASKAIEKAGIPKITIDIPGDGKFTIHNTKEALGQVLEKARVLNTSSGHKNVPVKTRGASPEDRAWVERQLAQGKAQESPETVHYVLAGKEWVPARGEKVELPNLKGSFFASRALDKGWKVTEETTGLSVGTGGTKKAALLDAIEKTKTMGQEKFDSIVKQTLAVPGRPPHPREVPATSTQAGTVQGFGGMARPRGGAVPGGPTPPTVVTPAVVAAKTPGLWTSVVQGIKSLLLPSSKSAAHLTEAERLGSKLGPMHQRQESAAAALRPASLHFDRMGVHNEKLPPGKNPGIQFMSDISQGRAMSAKTQAYADQITRLFADRLHKLEQAGAPLQSVRENYFPGMWTRESRAAFNAAMDEAVKKGIIPQNFDPNNATAAQKAAVKTRVDELLKAGQGSDKDMLPYLTRRPMKGQEGFRKEKVFDDIMDAAEFGLKPISNNPIDLVKGKLAEMDKSVMANEEFQSLREAGKLKTVSPYEDVPEGWVRVNDKYGTIYGPPTVDVPEYLDKAVYEGLVDFAKKLGIKHERSMQFPPGQGSRALGLSYQGQNLVRSRFGTETSVIAHEIGHQLDYRYDLWNKMVKDAVGLGVKGKATKEASQKMRGVVQKDLRNIADLTGSRGGDPRSKVEKIAQMVEAYVHAPEKMKQVAPTVFNNFDAFIKTTPELNGLANIKPGIELMNRTSEKYVGLPIKGYRIVPKETGDILNNYLSSSLYNNQFFGPLYKAWMGTANLLNQAQLGGGSAFHAGFTTGEVQVSAGAELIKDVYGVARGNRSPRNLANSSARWVAASVRTAVTGDKVLNAWRDPNGVLDTKLRQVVRAAELAGGGFKLEHGMTTEQSAKVFRDWFSGHRVRAAMRTPMALTELMSKPIMNYLVPRQKAGVFAELANRIIEQNPGKALEDLTPQFRQAWNRVDSRLGQVRNDRLFANNTAKNVIQALVRAPGWTGGTIAEIGGALPDAAKWMKEFVQTGKPPAEMPDRVAYTLSLLTTVMAANAILTYALSGRKPTGMDYMAFTDGTKDDRGNTKRWLLPSYMKDLLAYQAHPGTTVLNKSHPALSVIADVLKNKDYYGYEIRDPHANLGEQALQTSKYVLKSFEPFWIRGAQKTTQEGGGLAADAAAYVGVMPAPASVTMTPMQREISDLYHKRTGEGVKPHAKQFAPQKTRDKASMDVYMFKRLPESDKAALRAKMTAEERARY